MSFIKKILDPKFLSSILLVFVLAGVLFVTLPTKKAYALFGLGDIVEDPFNLLQNTTSAIANPVTAAGTSVNAANTTAQNVKMYVLDTLAVTLARTLVQGITAQTVNWINSGFQGNPGFVTNPQQFFTNIADYTVSAELNSASGGLFNKLCSPFSVQVRLALVNNYLYQNLIGQCTLGQLANNYENWANNFSAYGGWTSWFQVTQNAQNNPYGAYLAAQDELSVKVANQTGLKGAQLQTNGGILNFKVCKNVTVPTEAQGLGVTTDSSAAYNNCLTNGDANHQAGDVSYCEQNFPIQVPLQDTSNSEVPDYPQNEQQVVAQSGLADQYSQSNYTTQVCNTQTPGSLVNAQLEKVFGSGVDQLNLTQSINQIANALITEAAKSIIGGVEGGLRGTASPSVGSSRSLLEQLATTSATSQAVQQNIYNATTAQVPSSTQYAAGLSSTTPQLTPVIDQNAIQNEVNQQTAAFQAQYGGTSTGTSGTTSTNTNTAGNQALLSSLYNEYSCANPTNTIGQCEALVAMQNGETPQMAYDNFGCSSITPANTAQCLVVQQVENGQ